LYDPTEELQKIGNDPKKLKVIESAPDGNAQLFYVLADLWP